MFCYSFLHAFVAFFTSTFACPQAQGALTTPLEKRLFFPENLDFC